MKYMKTKERKKLKKIKPKKFKILNTVKGFEDFDKNYVVTSNGEVWNRYTGKMLNKKKNKNNDYERVTLYDRYGNARYYTVHFLVSCCYIPNPDNLPEIDHIDRNKKNNKVENLRWIHRSKNRVKDVDKVKTTILDLTTLEIFNFNSISEASNTLDIPYDLLYRIRLSGNQLFDGYHVWFY